MSLFALLSLHANTRARPLPGIDAKNPDGMEPRGGMRFISGKRNAKRAAFPGRRKISATHRAFFHPDFTVGPGVSPDHARPLLGSLAGSTAGRDLAVIARRPHRNPEGCAPPMVTKGK